MLRKELVLVRPSTSGAFPTHSSPCSRLLLLITGPASWVMPLEAILYKRANLPCGYPIYAVIYFVGFIVLANSIFMNLFVTVILDAVSFGLVNENAMITSDHLDNYKKLWSDFDPRHGVHRHAQATHLREGFGIAAGTPTQSHQPMVSLALQTGQSIKES